MIIVEGPDGSGKTTLAYQLSKELDLEVRRYPGLSHTSGPDGPQIVEWWERQLIEAPVNVVYDRCFYISEIPYTLTSDRPLLSTPEQIIHGIANLWAVEPLIIFCLPGWGAEFVNINRREQLEGVSDLRLKKISWAYSAFYAMWSNALFADTIFYDYQNAGHQQHILTTAAAHLNAIPR